MPTQTETTRPPQPWPERVRAGCRSARVIVAAIVLAAFRIGIEGEAVYRFFESKFGFAEPVTEDTTPLHQVRGDGLQLILTGGIQPLGTVFYCFPAPSPPPTQPALRLVAESPAEGNTI